MSSEYKITKSGQEPLDVVRQKVPVLAGLSILAVDDNEDNLDLLKYILEEVGARVIVTMSARETLAVMRASPGGYDVLLADIGMPDEDGLALIRQVRALDAEDGGQILAIALTAHVSDKDRQMAVEAGFQMHLAKPIDPVHLVLSVASLVERRGGESV